MSNFVLSAFADEIDSNFDVQISVLKQHKIKYIELRGVDGRNIIDYTLDEAKRVKSKLEDANIKLSAIGSPIGKININDDFKPHLELFKHALDLASILDSEYIRMFSFYIPQNESPDIYEDKVISRWNAFIEVAKDYNVTLLHENEKGIYGDTPERCLKLFETLNTRKVGMTFDPANFVQCDVETHPYAFDMLKDYISYMHIKDALYSNHQVVPAGHGNAHIEELLLALDALGYDGFLSIEPHLGSFTGLAELEEDPLVKDMPEGGERLFAIAVNALKKLL